MTLKDKILSQTKSDLSEIETALVENLTPNYSLVRDTAKHILFAGGKRLRPLLMVLCARLCGSNSQDNYRFSTIFEYLHTATLLHDDLVDDADLRRGNPVAHKIYGNETAVLTGDFLLARALSIAADTRLLSVIRIISNITEQMAQGEIEQLHKKGKLDLSEEEYMEIIRRKTAVLIEGACQVGGLVAGVSEAEVDQLKAYGYNLGMAFQMADDLLDFIAETDTLGKTVGADLKEGKLTLPVIISLKNAGHEAKAGMLEILKKKSFSAEEFNKFLTYLETNGGILYTTQKAQTFVQAAKASLSSFSSGRDRDLLVDIADYALDRKI